MTRFHIANEQWRTPWRLSRLDPVMDPCSARHLVAISIVAAVMLSSRMTRADEAHGPAPEVVVSALDANWAVDVPVTIAGGVLGGALVLLRPELVDLTCLDACRLPPENFLDRPAVGLFSSSAKSASDVMVFAGMAAPFVVSGVSAGLGDHPEGWYGFAEDAMILAETLSISVALHQTVSMAVQRTRPYAHHSVRGLSAAAESNTYLSFYSGHSANGFAMATAGSLVFSLRHPDSPWIPAVWTMSHGAAALTAYLRVAAGYHYPTDVLTGAAIGSALGALIPLSHRVSGSTVGVTPAPLTSPLGQPGLGLLFYWHPTSG